MADEYMYLGEVPKSVYDKELKKYLNRKTRAKGARPVKAGFTYNGIDYAFHGRGDGSYKLDRQSKRTQAQATRRGRSLNQQVKLSSVEQMFVDNYYEEASKRGLQVDHKAPLAKGGPSNHPAFLGLMTPKENQRKGDTIGGNWKYEPFLDFSGGNVRLRHAPTMVESSEDLEVAPRSEQLGFTTIDQPHERQGIWQR